MIPLTTIFLHTSTAAFLLQSAHRVHAFLPNVLPAAPPAVAAGAAHHPDATPCLLRQQTSVSSVAVPVRFRSRRSNSRSNSRMSASESSAATPIPAIATVGEAKDNLRRALEASKGSTLAEEVSSAAEALSKFNPTSSPARAWSVHSGDWVSIGQDFVGTTRTADGLECTLGRLAFNVFEPVKLPILITDTSQTIGKREENVDPTEEALYTICTRWVARDGSGLKGRMELRGSCWEDPSKPDRVMVKFSSGEIKPDDGQDLDAWREVIGVRGMKDAEGEGGEDEQPSLLGKIKDKATKLMMKVMFGFEGPSDTLGPDGELRYYMKRSPKALLDILFLDDEMRVTRGQRGALVVVTRST